MRRVVAGGILLVLLLAWLRVDVVLLVALASLAIAAGAVWRALKPRVKQAAASLATETGPLVDVRLLPPTLRARERAPIAFTSLVDVVEQAQLGEVQVGPNRLRLESGRHFVEVRASSGLVTLPMLQVEASQAELALLVCDAMVRALGSFKVSLDGVELDLDGTQPRAQLSRLLWLGQTERVRQLESALRQPEAKPRKNEYLH
jgi:hypothetical protein